VAYCRVRVSPFGQAQGGQFQELVLAHELFHCFQNALAPNSPFLPLWIREGTADWAAVTVDPVPASVGAGPYKLYLKTVNSSLFSRAYDGSGFWGRADEVGGKGSLWAKLPGILTAGNAASYVLAGGASDGFVSTWASAALRFVAGGSAWNQRSPFTISSSEVTAPIETVASGATLASSPYAVELYAVLPDGDAPMVSVLSSSGRLRAASKGDGDLGVISGQRWLCFGGDCRCPEGTEGEVPPHQNVSGGVVYLGLTGGNRPGGARASYHSLDEWCKEPESGGGGGGGGGRGPGGGIEVRRLMIDNGGFTLLGTIRSGKCSFTGGSFRATGSGSGFRMTLRIAGARKKGTYPIPYGSRGTYVSVNGYSSLNSPPRAVGVGGIKIETFRVKKRIRYRISVGFTPLFNASLGAAVALSPAPGGLVC
jgi:hypothetical protein